MTLLITPSGVFSEMQAAHAGLAAFGDYINAIPPARAGAGPRATLPCAARMARPPGLLAIEGVYRKDRDAKETEMDALAKAAMPTQELVVQPNGDIWEVRLGEYLLSAQLTEGEALAIARIVAKASAIRGVQTKILAGDLEGNTTDVTVERAKQRLLPHILPWVGLLSDLVTIGPA
jgi:hypothetical protein